MFAGQFWTHISKVEIEVLLEMFLQVLSGVMVVLHIL